MTLDTKDRARVQTRLAPEVRRQQIVEQATRLIAQSGFNAVSLADIADACGIRKPSVLHYFPTMQDLLAAVLAKRDADAYDGNVLPTGLGGRAEVRAYFQQVVEHNFASREIVGLFVVLGAEAVDPDHPAHDYFAERNRLTLLALQDMLSWKANPEHAAAELLAFWQGLESLWVAVPSVDFLAVWAGFCDRFFD